MSKWDNVCPVPGYILHPVNAQWVLAAMMMIITIILCSLVTEGGEAWPTKGDVVWVEFEEGYM